MQNERGERSSRTAEHSPSAWQHHVQAKAPFVVGARHLGDPAVGELELLQLLLLFLDGRRRHRCSCWLLYMLRRARSKRWRGAGGA